MVLLLQLNLLGLVVQLALRVQWVLLLQLNLLGLVVLLRRLVLLLRYHL